MYSDSQLQMLKDPLVNVYADIVSFGLGAVKLLNKSRIRKQAFSFTCAMKAHVLGLIWNSLSNSLQGELDRMVSSMEGHLSEVDRIAAVEHMNETHQIKQSTLQFLPPSFTC